MWLISCWIANSSFWAIQEVINIIHAGRCLFLVPESFSCWKLFFLNELQNILISGTGLLCGRAGATSSTTYFFRASFYSIYHSLFCPIYTFWGGGLLFLAILTLFSATTSNMINGITYNITFPIKFCNIKRANSGFNLMFLVCCCAFNCCCNSAKRAFKYVGLLNLKFDLVWLHSFNGFFASCHNFYC